MFNIQQSSGHLAYIACRSVCDIFDIYSQVHMLYPNTTPWKLPSITELQLQDNLSQPLGIPQGESCLVHAPFSL